MRRKLQERSDSRAREGGYSAIELIAGAALVAVMAVVLLPSLNRFYDNHQLDSAATMFQSVIQRARIDALKEKASYRLVIHDTGAATPNRLELQRLTGGSWVSVAGQTHELSETIDILGNSPSDSVDSITVSERGVCTSGNVYLHSNGGDERTVSVEITCITSRS